MPLSKFMLERIETFGRNLESYLAPDYKEAQVRSEFIDPLFSALGWDVRNEEGRAEAYKDVVHEDTLKLSAGTKAPDYSFRIGGTRKFFVEAKKPSVSLKDDPEPALQLRRYSWSARLPLGIVTDFQEFAIYDTRIRPKEGDKASTARIFYCTYEQYPEKWGEIAGIFARDAILKGFFDKYAVTAKGKRGTAAVDDAFLEEIEHWRDLLARNLALRNPTLSQRDLNFAVQRILDRIIFLRIAEDRGIESYGQLLALTAVERLGPKTLPESALRATRSTIYPRLCEIFERADYRYNSGLFHFHAEKDRDESPDKLTLGLSVDDAALKEILGSLYYPKSPYAFAVIPADILGHVYEQFLGKVIHLTAGHQARVEEKPEVRKAGGVYYTPTYIVDYIVRQTVGPLVEGKTPKQVEKLRLLDPACGSGSFLLGAFEFLLDWHLKHYVANDPAAWAKKKHPPIYETAPNAGYESLSAKVERLDPKTLQPDALGSARSTPNWQLTTAERKRILLDNLFGVDIDPQAVEVTKLSLLLKVLEGEAREQRSRSLTLDLHRVLPDLGQNIKCGNSLIGSDFYRQLGLPEMDDEARIRINAFDWPVEFKPIMDAGGFDAVIGNPPYGAVLNDAEKDYIKNNYAAHSYKFDTYIYFIERAIGLMNKEGRSSFITPELWTRLESNQAVRSYISKHASLSSLRIFGEGVFADAVVSTCVFVLSKKRQEPAISIETPTTSWKMPASVWLDTPNLAIDHRLPPDARIVVEKILGRSVDLGSLGESIQGITPYDRYRGQSPEIIKSRAYHASTKKNDSYGPWLEGKDVSRYRLGWSGEWLSYGSWLGAPREPKFFNGRRLLFREVPGAGKRIQATIAESLGYYGHSITPFLPSEDCPYDLAYLLGISNSKLLSWYGGLMLPNFGKDIFPKINPQDIKALPIVSLKLSLKGERVQHDALVTHVERMLKLREELAAAKAPDAQTRLQREIRATDAAIDRLVYSLYGLTADEIRLVESATSAAKAAAESDG